MLRFGDLMEQVISNFRVFGLRDVIDIAVVALAMYQIFVFARKSRAGQLVRGLLLLFVFYALANLMELRTVRWVLTSVMQIGFIAAIVLFQPELRRTLERIGQSTNLAKMMFSTRKQDPTLRGAWQSAVVAICDAAEQLSDTRTGALMVLERVNNLDEIIRTGTPFRPMSSPRCWEPSSMREPPFTMVPSSSGTDASSPRAVFCRCPTTWKWARTWEPATVPALA